MNARDRIASVFPWAVAVAVGVVVGLGLTAYFIDEHANKTCGLIPSTVGLIVLIPAGLGLTALISLFVATRPAEDTRRLGMWLLFVAIAAAGVFIVGAMLASQQIPAGCHRNA